MSDLREKMDAVAKERDLAWTRYYDLDSATRKAWSRCVELENELADMQAKEPRRE